MASSNKKRFQKRISKAERYARDPQRISKAVERRKSKAERYARDPQKAGELLDKAIKKSKKIEHNQGPLEQVWGHLTALFRLLKAYIRNEYRELPRKTLILVIIAIIYFVSTIDLIPDTIPVLGFIDDAWIIHFVVNQIKAELDKFLTWEERKESS